MFLPTTKQGQEALLTHRRVIVDVYFGGATPSASVRHGTDAPDAIFLSSEGRDDITADDDGANLGTITNNAVPASGPSVPSIGTAQNFAILAAAAITGSTGAGSTVNGQMGISPNNLSSVTNFPPSTSGTIHAADAAAAQAMTDATALFTDLNSRPSTVIASELGGQTLNAGVYSFASGSAQITGGLTLTFNGSASDLFVIKTASTLTTGVGAGGMPVIAFTGGAGPANVFWVIGSSATINSAASSAGAVFSGTVVAQVSVTATQIGTINGRLFALTGAVTLSNTNLVNGTPVPAGATPSALGVLIDGPKTLGGIVKKLYTLTVTEVTSLTGTVSRALKGLASTGITEEGNIAFTIGGTSTDLRTQQVTYRVLCECMIDELQHDDGIFDDDQP